VSNSFNLIAENPNIPSGSNGCLCHELGGHDTKGPFVVFAATETDNYLAPFPVLCAGCAVSANKLVIQSSLPVSEPKRELEPARQTRAKRSVDDGDGPTI
jgi:hypothetical protein